MRNWNGLLLGERGEPDCNLEGVAMTHKLGQRVTWLHEPKGGYGYTIPVDGVVRKIGPKRIQIEAKLKSGDTKLTWVNPSKLRNFASGEFSEVGRRQRCR
jgi:hypothetical protein